MRNTSVIELSKEALCNNLRFLKNRVGDERVYSSVVKGNAYGHGIEVFPRLAKDCGIRHFSVFDSFEAYTLHESFQNHVKIMIMGMVEPEAVEWCVENDIEFYVFDQYRLQQALSAAKKVKKPARIHIELETGMNRTGIPRKLFEVTLNTIRENEPLLEVKGLCTHFAGAESVANYYRIQRQYKMMQNHIKWFEKRGFPRVKHHTACSAAMINFPKTMMDMVRIGILQYGYWPSRETFVNFLGKNPDKHDPLKRVITWKTHLMDIKSVKTGEFVGYGTTFMAENDITVASIPVGYSHGYSRSLSNHGRVLLHGQRVSVIGLVNMNMMLIDVTNVENPQPGDEVVLIGSQGDLDISVASFGELSNQLNYELLTRLPKDIPRIIVD